MANPLRRIARLPKAPRRYIRAEDFNILRDRRPRKIELGEDPLEQRAISKGTFPGATLPERIVYKKLAQMLGNTRGFIFQRSEQGGRNFLGGYVIDFVVINPPPGLAIEVLGDHWHRAERAYADQERAIALLQLGYGYEEIWEHDILHSDELLEQILRGILGGRVSQQGGSATSGRYTNQ